MELSVEMFGKNALWFAFDTDDDLRFSIFLIEFDDFAKNSISISGVTISFLAATTAFSILD